VTELPHEALLLDVREPLALPIVGELGELIHGGLLPCDGGGPVVVVPLSRTGAGGHHT
jgi:hypothetical protein